MIVLLVGWLRSRGLPFAIAGCAVAATLSALAPGAVLNVPFLPGVLRMPVLVAVITTMVVTPSLQGRFGVVERTTVRVRTDRLLGGVLAIALAAGAAAPLTGAVLYSPWPTLSALLAAALLAVTAIGSWAWAVPTAAGLVIVYLDIAQFDAASATLDAVGVPTLAAAVAAALGVYVLRGPSGP